MPTAYSFQPPSPYVNLAKVVVHRWGTTTLAPQQRLCPRIWSLAQILFLVCEHQWASRTAGMSHQQKVEVVEELTKEAYRE